MIHYINTSTADDFVKSEVSEHGWDYVEAQFALGYEPTAVNGFWCWRKSNVAMFSSGLSSSCTLSSTNAQTVKVPIRA